jgi:hypothetical protein
MRPLRSLLWLAFGCFLGGMLMIAADRVFPVQAQSGRLAWHKPAHGDLKMSKRALKKLAAAGSALVVAMQTAHAAVPTDVTSSLDALKADATSVATVVLVAVIAIFAIKFIRKGL